VAARIRRVLSPAQVEPAESGTVPATFVPPAGRARTTSRPPTAVIRLRMLVSPVPVRCPPSVIAPLPAGVWSETERVAGLGQLIELTAEASQRSRVEQAWGRVVDAGRRALCSEGGHREGCLPGCEHRAADAHHDDERQHRRRSRNEGRGAEQPGAGQSGQGGEGAPKNRLTGSEQRWRSHRQPGGRARIT
jgi:hypothetical protein